MNPLSSLPLVRWRTRLVPAFCLSVALAAGPALATDGPYPARPVTLVVPYAPGGATDILARILGEELAKRWGQPVVIDNRVGASGQIGTEYVGKAKGDPYKLVIGTQAVFSVLPTLNNRPDFNLDTGYTPISLLIQMPSLLLVPSSLGVQSTEDLIRLLRAGKPNQYAYSSNGVGTSQQLIAADFLAKTDTSAVHVPYKGSSQALAALAAGDQVAISVDNIPSALPLLQTGKIKALAVTTAARSPKLPDVPTVAESGVAGFDQSTWIGLMAPPGIPAEVQQFLNREVRAVVALPAVQARLKEMAFVPRTTGTDEFRTFVAKETVALKLLLARVQVKDN